MRDFSPHQKKIIKRYYENRDDLDDQRLSELVADLYLAEGKKRQKLWQTARELMERLNLPAKRIDHVVASGDPALLAEVVKELQAGLHRAPDAKPPK